MIATLRILIISIILVKDISLSSFDYDRDSAQRRFIDVNKLCVIKLYNAIVNKIKDKRLEINGDVILFSFFFCHCKGTGGSRNRIRVYFQTP